jgi:hypothetical protein
MDKRIAGTGQMSPPDKYLILVRLKIKAPLKKLNNHTTFYINNNN